MQHYRAVFLDAGFTLLKIKSPWEHFVLEIAADCGLDLTLEEARAARKTARDFFQAHYYRPNETWTNDREIMGFWRGYYRASLETLDCPPEQVGPCAEQLAMAMNQPEAWRAYPEVPDVLARLKREGYTVAVLSDWSSSLPHIVDQLGLGPLVDFFVVSAIEGVAKPQPAFFQRALDQAQVSPHQALMVGDSLYADLQGAGRVGIPGVLIDRAGRSTDPVVPTITHLGELWRYLDGRAIAKPQPEAKRA